ncbi:hypothetical protein [uncultured Azohydromonas sp.]|jgi:hypothetical protein|uniref:hypothetical protein n=1 Tax=uncultured Azohydromonas sp. TaxID=487342 RepID=UPI0026100E83|nr:hypothetical protein [uncultured Azohydromonas sp.]
MERQRNTQHASHAVSARTTYEASVIGRALDRAGHNPHLKGHIHEILVKDARNAAQLLTGRSTSLTRSTTAEVVDLVTTRGGKVVERLQLKDTLSKSAVDKVVRQVAQGKYRSVQLVGTEETTEVVNAALKRAGLSKRMVSSGVSSETTTSLAQRAGACGSGSVGSAVSRAAQSGGAMGAAVGAGVEVVKGIGDLIDGRRDAGEVTASVAKAGAKGYATGAAASAAATATGAAVASGVTALGIGASTAAAATVAAPVVAAVAVGYVVSSLFDALFD